MLYTAFGDTGVEASRLGFGGMRFETPQAVDEMAEVVFHAFERGITYFDTAPDYCDEMSEIICGAAFKEMKKTGRPFLASSKTMAATPDAIRRQCEQSLDRLQLDVLDFYHVWCLVHPEDLSLRKGKGVLKAFQQLKEEGLIRHISVSTHLEHQHIEAMLEEGEGLFESMLLGLNILNHHLRYPGVLAAARRNMAVVTMNTLGGGILTKYEERFRDILRPEGTSMVDAAVRFNLSLPGITTALVGFRNCADVDDAVQAVEKFEPLTSSDIESLSESMRLNYRDFCTQCGYCSGCPQGIPVVRLMEAYNVGLMEGMETAIRHLRYHWNSPDVAELLASCTQCGACEQECTQQLPILSRFAELKETYETMRSS